MRSLSGRWSWLKGAFEFARIPYKPHPKLSEVGLCVSSAVHEQSKKSLNVYDSGREPHAALSNTRPVSRIRDTSRGNAMVVGVLVCCVPICSERQVA